MEPLVTMISVGTPALVGGAAAAAWLALYPPTPRDLGGARNLDREAEPVRIPLPDGDRVEGWYLDAPGPSVLLLHGYGRTHHRMWRYARFLGEAGYSLLAIDFRSSRSGRRLPTTLGAHERVDAQAALHWLGARAPGRPLVLFGESLGGTVALVIAAASPEVAAVIVDCPFASGREAVEDMVGRFLRLPRWPTVALARRVGRWVTRHDLFGTDALAAAGRLRDRPILFIHSERDERLSPSQSECLWRAAGGKDPFWRVPRAGHNQAWLFHPEEYERRVLRFLAGLEA